jgi:GT2 family glycosyltransferase
MIQLAIAAFRLRRERGASWSALVARCFRNFSTRGFGGIREAILRPSFGSDYRDSYRSWIRRGVDAARADQSGKEVSEMQHRPVFSIVMPTFNSTDEWLVRAIESVRGQSYPHWELCIADDASTLPSVRATLERYMALDDRIRVSFRKENGHIARATNDAMALMRGDYMCLMDHDDEIAPHALLEFARIINEDPLVEFIYSDEDKLDLDGQRYEPFFKPDWSPILLESCMYTAHFACYRVSIVRQVGGFRPECNGAQDYDFVLRFAERVTRVRHVPKILYHWRAIPGSTAQSMDNKDYVISSAIRALSDRCARTGEVDLVKPGSWAGSFACRRKIVGNPKVSIIIPSAGRSAEVRGAPVDLLANCVHSIYSKSSFKNFEVIIVDNGDLTKKTRASLARFPARYISYRQSVFNVAARMNLGATVASGDFLLFLNDDTEVISGDWLEAMIAVAQRPNVGMVGAKLRFEDGALQHVGVTTCHGWPDHIRRGFPANDPGYFFSSVTTREVLAVTGACCLIPRALFGRVGGFNEDFAVNYNDIDLCMRVRATGASIVFTSQAELFHFESKNRARTVDQHELSLWNSLWSASFSADPYYSPIFGVSPPNYEPDFDRPDGWEVAS